MATLTKQLYRDITTILPKYLHLQRVIGCLNPNEVLLADGEKIMKILFNSKYALL